MFIFCHRQKVFTIKFNKVDQDFHVCLFKLLILIFRVSNNNKYLWCEQKRDPLSHFKIIVYNTSKNASSKITIYTSTSVHIDYFSELQAIFKGFDPQHVMQVIASCTEELIGKPENIPYTLGIGRIIKECSSFQEIFNTTIPSAW